MKQHISDAIRRLRDNFVETGRAKDFATINNGLCEDFALATQSQLGLANLYPVWTEAFYKDPPNDEDYDVERLENFWGIKPPEGWDWEKLNRVPFASHCWITFEKRHYDAECPDGVESFFDLPFFRCYLEHYRGKN